MFWIFSDFEDFKPNKNKAQKNNKRMILIRGRITPATYKIELFVTSVYDCKTVNNLYQVLHLRCLGVQYPSLLTFTDHLVLPSYKTFWKKILWAKFINRSYSNSSNINTAFNKRLFTWRSEVNIRKFEIHTGLKILRK